MYQPKFPEFYISIVCLLIYPKGGMMLLFKPFFVVMPDQNFVLSDPDGVLVGHDVLSRKKIYSQPCSDAVCFGEMMSYLKIILSNVLS